MLPVEALTATPSIATIALMTSNKLQFGGKVAVVTGGSSGIGLATAKRLSRMGAHVWLIARRRDRLESALAEVNEARNSAEQRCGLLAVDVTDAEQADHAIAELVRVCGPPDVLVNCAGDVEPCLFCEADVGSLRRQMEVNFFGTVNMCHACLKSMLARRSGHIVIVSSVYGFIGGYGYSAYCASKFALRGFSDSLRAEVKPLGIGVSIVFPQNTETPQLKREEQMKTPMMKAIDNTKGMSAEDVAKSIVHGIARRQYVIIPGFEGRFLFWLTGFLGPGTYWVMDRMVAKARKKVEKAGN